MSRIPREEYPRPQFVRKEWENLNGTWEFEFDHGASGRERGLIDSKAPYGMTIEVPFCPESELSGIGYKDFMSSVWYRRRVKLSKRKNKRILLHFGAVDYESEVWVNGTSVGKHRGGYTSFAYDITEAAKSGENVITVCAEDDSRGKLNPSGKQCFVYNSIDCHYTRTTGIWQTVWIEYVPETYIRDIKMVPDAENGTLALEAHIEGYVPGTVLGATAALHGKKEAEAFAKANSPVVSLLLSVEDIEVWEPGSPVLYDLKLSLKTPEGSEDKVDSYFGLRTVSIEGKKVLLNGKPVFQRLVLDQGFYPDGIYTAPTDAALKRDIELSVELGFNGARLHQKVFEQRFLYWADKLGYLVWGEMPSWGVEPSLPGALESFLPEWMEAVQRDFNSPSIVGWCPFNEVWGESGNGNMEKTLAVTYRVTKALDPTRPVIDSSGGYHGKTDIYDTHDYEQNGKVFAKRYRQGSDLYDEKDGERQHYDGKAPVMVSEFGGIRWADTKDGWGYGEAPKTKEEFIDRYVSLTSTLMKNPEHMGFCYTQLYDVEQEKNGLYNYDRTPKFDSAVLAAPLKKKAAIEKE